MRRGNTNRQIGARERVRSLGAAYRAFIEAHANGWEALFAVLALAYVGLDIVSDTSGAHLSPFIDSAQIALTIIFVLEFVSRLAVAPDRRKHLQSHWVDAFALLPPMRSLRSLRLIRLVRVVTGARRVGMNVPALTRHRDFLSLVTTWIGLGVVLSLVVYTAELGASGANVTTPLDALWWAVGSLTTVGTELYPVTFEGRLAAMLLTLVGAFVFSAITATITSFLIGGSRTVDVANQLERLVDLRASGALSDEEFHLAKSRALGESHAS